jgi:arginase
MRKIKLIEVPSEIGAGTRGASLGIDAIRIAALDFMSNLFVRLPSEQIPHENHLLYEPVRTQQAKRIDGLEKMYQRVSDSVSRNLAEGNFPVVLSGDHSIAGATIAGIRMAIPEAKLGVIWIDAHSDLHTPYTTPSGNMHGMPMAVSIGEDNLESAIHKPEDNTVQAWNRLKNLGNISPKIEGENVVFIALRDFEKEEQHIIQKHAMKVITIAELRRKGTESVVKKVFRQLADCTHIYISLDMDSIDPTISRGTGTPVSNGLREREAEDLMSKFMQHRKICCFEITEVNPTLDRENLMAEIAFQILQRSVNILMVH